MNMSDMLKKRAEMKKRRPSFTRSEGTSKNTRKTKDSWRKPRGRDNKLRRSKNGEAIVSRGYSVPKAVRGLHSTGLSEILVHNVSQLKKADPKKEVARIASSVGLKKKIMIVEEAKKLKIKVLNPLYRKKEKKEKPKKAHEVKKETPAAEKKPEHHETKATEEHKKEETVKPKKKDAAPKKTEKTPAKKKKTSE